MPTVVHFDMPADNVQRAQRFYSDVFGWKFSRMETKKPYWSIKTRARKGQCTVSGGMMKREMPGQMPVNYISVSSIDQHWKKAKDLGAKVVVPKTTVPKMGYFMILMDTEQNPIGMWEDDVKASYPSNFF